MGFGPLQQLLADRFRGSGPRIAIEKGHRHITYQQLHRHADAFTSRIIAENLAPGSFIGIYCHDEPALIAAILGVLNARCVFVILDTRLPIRRLHQMVRSTGTQFVFTLNPDLKDEFQSIDSRENVDDDAVMFCPMEEEPSADAEPIEYRDDYNKEDPIYVYFTSGSTGVPSAMVGKNESLCHFLDWQIRTFNFDNPAENIRVSQLTAPGFDAFLRDLFIPLLTGGTLCIPPAAEDILDSYRLVKWLDDNHINVIHCVPGVMRIFNRDWLTGSHFSSLKYIFLSGEPLIPRELGQWYGIFKERIQLINLYGTSETTMIKVFHPVKPEDIELPRIPVGLAIDGAEVFVLDEDLDECDDDIVGDVYIRTRYRTLGYHNNPDLNRERFILNPVDDNPEPDDLFHKTGDIGKYLGNGNLDVLGRSDRQVKIRGVRAELEEIEAVLAKHPDVGNAAVIARSNDENGEDTYLCAYAVPVDAGNQLTPDSLHEFCGQYLPDALVPSYFMQLEMMPLNANGKIDRKALPKPVFTGGENYTAPRDDLERQLVEIWAEALRKDESIIGIDSNFFRIGGHSLKATMVIEKIHKRLNIRLPLVTFFKTPNIRDLARYMKENREETFAAIEPVEKREYYPLSSAQKRLYIIHQLDRSSLAYNMPQVLPLEARVDADYLEGVVNAIIERHESFRTSFQVTGNETVQVIHDTVTFQLEFFTDSSHASSFSRPFDLEQAPLLRVGILRGGDDGEGDTLLVDMHHIITDGVSMGILTSDFSRIFQGAVLAPLNIQYKDFSQWQNSEKERLQEQETYWLNRFERPADVLELPVDFSRPALPDFTGAAFNFEIPGHATSRLREMALEVNGTLYMVLLAVFNVLLHKLTGQEDIVIGTPIAGRRHADLEPVIGMFVNTLAMRNFPQPQTPFNRFLEEVREHALGAFEHQDYQLEDLVERVCPISQRDNSRNPLFDVVFVLQNMGENLTGDTPRDEGQKDRTVPGGPRSAKFELSFVTMEAGDAVACLFQYRPGLYKAATMERWSRHYLKLIEQIADAPATALADLRILSEAERQQVVETFNRTRTDFPGDQTVVTLFHDQVEKHPDRIAVTGSPAVSVTEGFGETAHLTYGELDRLSTRIARILKEKGAGSGSITAILMLPSIEIAVAIMAILKSGGAYLPVDPLYPDDRIAYMLRDSGASLVITAEEIEQLNTAGYNQLSLLTVLADKNSAGTPDKQDENEIRDLFPPVSGLAYIIYTSGSTGRPKGVMVEHSGFFNSIYWRKREYCLPVGGPVLQLFSVAFDGFVTGFFTPLVSGAPVVLVPPSVVADPVLLIKTVERHQAVHFIAVASLYNTLMTVDQGRGLRSLQVVTLAGEAVPAALIERSRELYFHIELVNEYGATENAIVATYYRDMQPVPAVPVGKPIANTAIYVLDENAQPVPIGVPGEIYIAGPGIARGYLNKPELTAERFLKYEGSGDGLPRFVAIESGSKKPNDSEPPKGKMPGAIAASSSHELPVTAFLYKTGDKGRWLDDGNIEFLGRIDSQVKVRGYRIELGEIESCLTDCPGVDEAVVADHKDPFGQSYLCAYIVSSREPDQDELNRLLSGRLPGFMLPTFYMAIEKIPLTPNGKIDRKSLPIPTAPGGQEFVAPRNPLESTLVSIWADILGMEPARIGVHDDFFRIGGHSLNATILLARIHKSFNVQISLAEFFNAPTIEALASRIDVTGWVKSQADEPSERLDDEDMEEFVI